VPHLLTELGGLDCWGLSLKLEDLVQLAKLDNQSTVSSNQRKEQVTKKSQASARLTKHLLLVNVLLYCSSLYKEIKFNVRYINARTKENSNGKSYVLPGRVWRYVQNLPYCCLNFILILV
jgi:hypothetical protein